MDTITSSNFYSKFKENKENDKAAQVFWIVFIPADSRAKSVQQLILTMLPFHPSIFSMMTDDESIQYHLPLFAQNDRHTVV